MNTGEKWRSPETEGSYTRHIKNQDEISEISSKASNFDDISQTAIIEENREKIQKLQLKSANYKQKEIKLKRERDYLKKQVDKLQTTVEKLEEHRQQDAESLLNQEEELSQLKGRYRTSDNPNETKRTLNNIAKLGKEESKLIKEAKTKLVVTTENFSQLAEIVPQMYDQLRKLKFYGDKQMNEILLRQIQIYVDQLQEKAKEFSKQKLTNLDGTKNLRIKLKQKYDELEQLKEDTLEDHKQLFNIKRKLNFYETDFMIEREGIDKTR